MIIDYFKSLTEYYSSVNKCGFCWEYGAPLSESAMNNQQAIEDRQCCINVFVTDYQVSSYYQMNSLTGLSNYAACDHKFTLFVVQQRDDIGQNVFNEIPGHDITDSLWEELYSPILSCLGCDRNLYECELGYDFEVMAWDMTIVKFKDDRNLTGWKITGKFRVPNINTFKNNL